MVETFNTIEAKFEALKAAHQIAISADTKITAKKNAGKLAREISLELRDLLKDYKKATLEIGK